MNRRPAMRTGRLAAVVLAAALGLGGCAAPRPAVAVGAAPRVALPDPIPTRIVAPPPPRSGADFGPEILEPTGDGDAVVAEVGGVAIRASDVFARQLESDRQRAAVWVDAMVLDVVVAQMARRYDIRVDDAAVDTAVAEEEALLAAQIAREYGGRIDLAGYLERQLGLGVEEYRAALRRDLARVRFRGLVIRYVARLEDRAEVRFMVHEDPTVLADARARVAAGADFAQLARTLSQDETRRDGGRLGPFARAFRHPIAAAAFELAPGEQSAVFAIEDGARHALVYCLDRLPSDDRPFAECAAELGRELDARPVTPFEQTAFTLRYCRSTEGASPDNADR